MDTNDLEYSISRFSAAANLLTSEQLAHLSNLVREVAHRRGIDYELVYDEMCEIAELSGVLGERPPERDSSAEKKKWVRDNLADVRRKKSIKKAAHFLRWVHYYGPLQPAEATEGGTAFSDLISASEKSDLLEAETAAPSATRYLASNGLHDLAKLGAGSSWAQIVEQKSRVEMRGIGGRVVPKFPLDALVQVQIDPPVDGFVSLINIDEVDRNKEEIFLLNPLMNSTDLVAYAGERLTLPSPTAGLPMVGYANVRSKLIVCISEIDIFELWGKHLVNGEAFQPMDIQIRKFCRQVLSTSLTSRAIATIRYQS